MKGGKKYVQISFFDSDRISLNEKQVELDEQFDGYYGLVTSDKSLSPEKVIDVYHGLWKIEESFRVLKSNLEARPIFVCTESSIGHFVLCYLALVIERYLEYKLMLKNIGISTERIQAALKSANITVIKKTGSNEEYFLKNKSNEDYEVIEKALNIRSTPQYGKINQILA
jgi:transposase